MDCLCEYFMQEGNFEKMVEVGKLLSSVICTMFREYLNFNKGFVRFRYHKVVGYLKKLLQKYYLLRESQQQFMTQNAGTQSQYLGINSINNSPSRMNNSPSRQSSTKNQNKNNSLIDLRELNIEDLILLL